MNQSTPISWISNLYKLSKDSTLITNMELTNFAIEFNISLEYIEAMYEYIREKQLDTFDYDDDITFIYTFLLVELYTVYRKENESLQDIIQYVGNILSISIEAVNYHYETVKLRIP